MYCINSIILRYRTFNYKMISVVQTLTRYLDHSQQILYPCWLQGWQYIIFYVDWFLTDPYICRLYTRCVPVCVCALFLITQRCTRGSREAVAKVHLVLQSSRMEAFSSGGSEWVGFVCVCSSVNFSWHVPSPFNAFSSWVLWLCSV